MSREIVNIIDPWFLEKGKYAFFGDQNERDSLLDSVFFSDSLLSLIEIADLSDTKSITKNPRLKSFTFATLVCSALASRFNGKILCSIDWSLILECLLNPYISKEIFEFLKKNRFPKRDHRDELLRGVDFFFQRHLKTTVFYNVTPKTLKTFFGFFELEPKIVKILTSSVLELNNNLIEKKSTNTVFSQDLDFKFSLKWFEKNRSKILVDPPEPKGSKILTVLVLIFTTFCLVFLPVKSEAKPIMSSLNLSLGSKIEFLAKKVDQKTTKITKKLFYKPAVVIKNNLGKIGRFSRKKGVFFNQDKEFRQQSLSILEGLTLPDLCSESEEEELIYNSTEAERVAGLESQKSLTIKEKEIKRRISFPFPFGKKKNKEGVGFYHQTKIKDLIFNFAKETDQNKKITKTISFYGSVLRYNEFPILVNIIRERFDKLPANLKKDVFLNVKVEQDHTEGVNSYSIFKEILHYDYDTGLIVLIDSELHKELSNGRNQNDDFFSLDSKDTILTLLLKRKNLDLKIIENAFNTKKTQIPERQKITTLAAYKAAHNLFKNHLMTGFENKKINPRGALLYFKMKNLFGNLDTSIDNFNLLLNELKANQNNFYVTSTNLPNRINRYLLDIHDILSLEKASLILLKEDLNRGLIDLECYNAILDRLKATFYQVNLKIKDQADSFNRLDLPLSAEITERFKELKTKKNLVEIKDWKGFDKLSKRLKRDKIDKRKLIFQKSSVYYPLLIDKKGLYSESD